MLAEGDEQRPEELHPTDSCQQLAPELDKIIAPSEPIQELAEGFGGAQGPAEGPVWWKEGGYLLFSDIHNNQRMKYTPGHGVSVFQSRRTGPMG
jgi:gluconolactonase